MTELIKCEESAQKLSLLSKNGPVHVMNNQNRMGGQVVEWIVNSKLSEQAALDFLNGRTFRKCDLVSFYNFDKFENIGRLGKETLNYLWDTGEEESFCLCIEDKDNSGIYYIKFDSEVFCSLREDVGKNGLFIRKENDPTDFKRKNEVEEYYFFKGNERGAY